MHLRTRPFTFTVLSTETPGFFRMLRSAAKFGWPIQPFFYPMPVEDPAIFSKSYMDFMNTKHLRQLELVKKAYSDGYRRFVYVDAWDVIFTGKPTEVKWDKASLNFSGEGGFGGAEGAYPDTGYTDLVPETGPFKLLNAGVCWGDIVTFVDRCPKYEGFDQLLWYRELIRDPDTAGMRVDGMCETAVSIWGNDKMSDWSRIDGRMRLNLTNTVPCIIHGNGRWLIPPIFEK